MRVEKVRTVKSTISTKETKNHPYLVGAWQPNYDEYNAYDLESEGEIPEDINGVYIRNTENQIHEPIGRYHPFDGDGMIHAIIFNNGTADYKNRFIETEGFKIEQQVNKSLWAGLMEPSGSSILPGWGAQGGMKDSSSTDVTVHAGKILSTFYQCGECYSLDPISLDQLGKEKWVPVDGMSSHPKVDPRTGELLFFNYSKTPPYMNYGIVDINNHLKHYTPIPLPGPRLPHDMAFTENYTILNDLPMFWDAEMLKTGVHAVRLHDLPSRFAVIPRYGSEKDIIWFEAKTTFVLHWNNAYEEGDEIILEGYYQDNPWPESYEGAPPGLERLMAFLDNYRLKPKLYRWRFNLKTHQTKEETIDDMVIEFGAINQNFAGIKHRFAYSAIPTKGMFTFDGITKHDNQNGNCKKYLFGKDIYGSEVAFAPKINSKSEDDGYLVTITSNLSANKSDCLIFDAKDIQYGPMCKLKLPHRISSGTHATWASIDQIKNIN